MESSQSSNNCDGSDSQDECESFDILEVSNTSSIKDNSLYEATLSLIQEGRFESLKVDMCKSYLRHHGLRLSGKKNELVSRIKQHQVIINDLESVKKTYCPSTFTVNCKGDVCQGDIVLFQQRVYDSYAIEKRGGQNFLGLRTIIGKVVNDNYGSKKQQHTFTIDVIYSFGVLPLPPLKQLLIKGRNLYRIQTFRRPWDDENQRLKCLDEKHERGNLARKVKRGEMRNSVMINILKKKRTTEDKNTAKSNQSVVEEVEKKDEAVELEHKLSRNQGGLTTSVGKDKEKENGMMRNLMCRTVSSSSSSTSARHRKVEKHLKNLDLNLKLGMSIIQSAPNSNFPSQHPSSTQSHYSNSSNSKNPNPNSGIYVANNHSFPPSIQRTQPTTTIQIKSNNSRVYPVDNRLANVNGESDMRSLQQKDYANLIQQSMLNQLTSSSIHHSSKTAAVPPHASNMNHFQQFLASSSLPPSKFNAPAVNNASALYNANSSSIQNVNKSHSPDPISNYYSFVDDPGLPGTNHGYVSLPRNRLVPNAQSIQNTLLSNHQNFAHNLAGDLPPLYNVIPPQKHSNDAFVKPKMHPHVPNLPSLHVHTRYPHHPQHHPPALLEGDDPSCFETGGEKIHSNVHRVPY